MKYGLRANRSAGTQKVYVLSRLINDWPRTYRRTLPRIVRLQGFYGTTGREAEGHKGTP